MKFARFLIFGGAMFSASLLTFFVSKSFAQQEEEFEDDQRVDGIFDDEELEPLDEEDIDRPPRSERALEEEEAEDEISPIRRPRNLERRRSFNPRRRFDPSSRSGGSSSPPEKIEPADPARFASEIPNPNEKLRMDFVQVDIESVVRYFAERLRRKFIYDPSILSGKITIISPEEVTVVEAYQAFLSAMEIRGYAIYPSGAYYKIEKTNRIQRAPVPLYQNSLPEGDEYVTRIVTLKYLNVQDIRKPVADLVSRSGGDVIAHNPTNTLIISDYANNIKRIIRILNILDVEGFQEQIAVIQLDYASASEVAQKINDIFPTGEENTRSTRRSRRRRRRSSATSTANEGVIQKVVADERTNSLIILGSERGVEQVKKFIEQIDVPIEGGDGQIHVYPLQNVKAEDIAQTLSQLAQGESGASTSTSRSTRSTNTRRSRTRDNNQDSNDSSSGVSSAALFDGSIKITADPRTNSLVVQASPRDFEVLKGLIAKLDIRRRQVFIESVILEASVGARSDFGSQASGPLFRTSQLGSDDPNDANQSGKSSAIWGFGNLQAGTLANTLGGLLGRTALTGLALGFRSGGTVGVPVVNQETGETEVQNVPLLTAVVRLASGNDKLNILSTPHILATANEEAVISIGEEIPQVASVQATDGGNPIQNFNRIRVATELNITPQINAGDYLTLAIKQKVNEVGAEVIPDSGQVSTITREANTTAIVKDGQTIVIGGIMRNRKREAISKVPFLGDIPILGWLFKSRSSQTDKVNLLLFITPHIIRDTADMDDQFFRKLQEREGFLRGLGMDENEGVPISGYSREQLEMLDEEYINSLILDPLPRELPSEQVVPQQEIAPVQPENEPANMEEPPEENQVETIPIYPTPSESFEELEEESFEDTEDPTNAEEENQEVIAPESEGFEEDVPLDDFMDEDQLQLEGEELDLPDLEEFPPLPESESTEGKTEEEATQFL